MHSLATITRLNNAAFSMGALLAIKDGLFVVAKYDGLHMTSYQTFTSQSDAEAYAEKKDSERFPDERYSICYPAPAHAQLMAS